MVKISLAVGLLCKCKRDLDDVGQDRLLNLFFTTFPISTFERLGRRTYAGVIPEGMSSVKVIKEFESKSSCQCQTAQVILRRKRGKR